MSVYSISVFLHIVGALGLFAALALEWASVHNLRRAATTGQAREWARLLGGVRFVGGPSILTLLATGIYMSVARWGGQGWIGAGVGGVVLMAVLGGVLTGRRAAAIGGELMSGDGSLSTALKRRIQDPVLLLSARLRTALALGVVFVMSTKPGGASALIAMGAALVLGFAAGLPAWSSGRRQLASGIAQR
jgi:hypothetical protein